MLAGVDASQLEDDMATVRVSLFFHRAMVGLTAVVMVTSELCACIMRPASTSVIIPPHPVALCSVGFVANNIPFLSLNLSIVLGMLANIVLNVTAYSNGATGIQFSTILACLLASNKKARKHVILRLRQKYDTLGIGHWTCNIVTCPNCDIGGNNAVDPIVSIALVPLRREDPSALPTPARGPTIRVAR